MKTWFCDCCDFEFASNYTTKCPLCGKEALQLEEDKCEDCENCNCQLEH